MAFACTTSPDDSSTAYGLRSQINLAAERATATLGAELLGLVEGAAGEGLPRDPGGEAEVVLDLRARAGLTSRRVALEDEHVEPLAGGVHRGGEPGRTRAHHEEIPHRGHGEVGVVAERVRELLDRGAPEHQRVATDDDGYVAHGDAEALEHVLHVCLPLDVDVVEGVSVAQQELLEAQRARAVMRADEHHVALAAHDQADATEDERPHDELAQLGVRLHQGAERIPRHLQHLAVLGGQAADQAAPAGEHAHLPGELPGLQPNHRTLAVLARQHDLERSPEKDVESGVLRALLEEHLAPAHRSASPERCKAVDLLVRELGKHLPTALLEGILQHGRRYWPAFAGDASVSRRRRATTACRARPRGGGRPPGPCAPR